jgi:pyruvate/2-oxoglutarate dehydrogenase complex dihydrolipoamide acyltransferase (E2) component
MRIPILMPQLGESIAEATILRIEVAPGDLVQADQEIMEVETQKATMSVTIPCSGKVEEFSCRVGESYPVGTTLGFLRVTREEAARAGIQPVQDAPAAAADAAPAQGEHDNLHFKLDSTIQMHLAEAPQVIPTLTGLPVPVNATGASYISPRLRVRMQELGLNAADLSAVAGSGGGGRVTVEDFESFMAQLEEHKMTPASPMRIAVADSMRRSWTRPLATIGIRVNMEPLLAHRKQNHEPKAGPALYAMRALAIALSENTAAAGRLVGKRVVHPPAIDLGFAVEVEEGVLVPVIRAVDQKPLASLVEQYNDLVKRSRERKLPPDARGPGIATITNFGTFGIEWATPIPLPEQSLLLGLGAGIKQPVWDPVSHSFQPMTQSGLTLSFDHRVIDGGGAGRLLHRVASLMQTPEAL